MSTLFLKFFKKIQGNALYLPLAAQPVVAPDPFARALVNSGRLSVPSWLATSSLNTPDAEPFEGKAREDYFYELSLALREAVERRIAAR